MGKHYERCIGTHRAYSIELGSNLGQVFVGDEESQEWLSVECARHGVRLYSIDGEGIIELAASASDGREAVRRLFSGIVAGLMEVSVWEVEAIHGTHAEYEAQLQRFKDTPQRIRPPQGTIPILRSLPATFIPHDETHPAKDLNSKDKYSQLPTRRT